jgi:putative transposase
MSNSAFTTRTLRLRLKDKHGALLREHARAVNFTWNYCNELSFKHWERKREFLSAYDMQPYTKGAGRELGLHSQTVQAVQEEFVIRRKQFKKVKLRWRVSGGARRSLGWIPFKASAIRYRAGHVWYAGQALSLWDSYVSANFYPPSPTGS